MPSDKARNTEARLNVMIPYTYGSINTLNTNLGNNAHQLLLGSITQLAHIAGAGGGFSHSGVGTLGSAPTASEFNSLNTSFNNLVDGVNNLVTIFNALCSELQGSNLMA